jgi:hypothetical protein
VRSPTIGVLMQIHRFASSVRFVVIMLLVALASLCAGCSSSTDSGSSSGGTSGVTPSSGVAFRGTLTGKGESGVIDATLPAGTKTASVSPLAGEAATNTVVATINLGGGKTFSLTGTYDSATGTLTIAGGGFSLTGKLTGSTLTGTYTGPNGAGSFALQAAVTGAVNVYCGTYVDDAGGSGGGTWNLVQGADNKLSGSYTPTGGTGSGLLTGTLTGAAIALQVSTGGVANGTLAGDTINGTYGKDAATKAGTWTGTKGACAN